MKKIISVAIVEDVKDIREGLQLLIDNSEGFSCIHTFESGELAFLGMDEKETDVVLMDINLPNINGIETIKQLKQKGIKAQFIMCTVYEDDEHIFQSLKAGASGYILKNTEPNKILEAITDVFNGGSPMNSQIARRVIDSFQKSNSIDKSELLTPREKEMLNALSKGLRYKEIANEFGISIETVRSHARKIYEKLQVQSRLEALNKINGVF